MFYKYKKDPNKTLFRIVYWALMLRQKLEKNNEIQEHTKQRDKNDKKCK